MNSTAVGNEVAEFAERFLLLEQYDHIDELILTGGGCNVDSFENLPKIDFKILFKLFARDHPGWNRSASRPPKIRPHPRLERDGARGASVHFDYD